MRALVFDQFGGPLTVQTVKDPEPQSHSVVVRVVRTGVCRSDWHAWQGHDPDIILPHVPGHELAGEVVQCGAEVKRVAVGDRVTVPFVSGCGNCPSCTRGDPQVCDRQFQPGFTHFGSFAEYVELYRADGNVVVLPDEISFDVAASLGCRFTTAYRAVVQLAEVSAGQSLVIMGMGGVGLSALLIARALGVEVIAVDIDADKLEMARSLGASHCLNAQTLKEGVAQTVMDLTCGGADAALDALGSEQTLRQSILALRKRGRHVQVGLLIGCRQEPRLPMDRIVGWELVLMGSHGIASHSYPEVFNLIRKSKIQIERIVTPAIALADAAAALESMGQFAGQGIALIDPWR